eukprot:scaffold66672_cov19-Tisochrysis_lutea.AAC.2
MPGTPVTCQVEPGVPAYSNKLNLLPLHAPGGVHTAGRLPQGMVDTDGGQEGPECTTGEILCSADPMVQGPQVDVKFCAALSYWAWSRSCVHSTSAMCIKYHKTVHHLPEYFFSHCRGEANAGALQCTHGGNGCDESVGGWDYLLECNNDLKGVKHKSGDVEGVQAQGAAQQRHCCHKKEFFNICCACTFWDAGPAA